MAVSAGTAYLDVAPRIARTFSKDLTQQMVRPMAAAADRSGDDAGKRFGRRFSGGLRTGIGPVRGIVRGFGPALAAAFGGAAIVAGIKSVTDEAREAAVVGRITEARLKSTGGVANVTARQVEALATALSNKVGVDDEAIQSGANLMLTFKGVRNEAGRGNDIFNQATRAAVDLAAGMNNGKVTAEGLKTSNIQLGKALEDPIRGITALRRSGVSFTKQQRDQIKTMVESGDVLGAQKIILKAVNEQFGGTAAASADAGKRFSVFIGNLKERIGGVLLPILNKFLGFLVDKLPGAFATVGRWFNIARLGLDSLGDAFRGNGVTSDGFIGVMERIGVVIRAVVGWFQRTAETARGILGPAFRSIAEALRPAIAAFVSGLLPGLKTLWNVVKTQLWPVLKGLGIVIGVVLYAALRFVIPFILRLAGPVLGFLISVLAKAVGWVTNIIRWIVRAGIAAGRFAADIARHFRDVIGWFMQLRAAVLRVFSTAITWLTEAGKRLLRGLLEGAKFLWQHSIAGWLVARRAAIVGVFTHAASWLLEHGKNIIRGLWDGIKRLWTSVTTWLKDIPGKILRALGFGSPPQWAIQAGRDIMSSILDGLKSKGQSALNFLKTFASGIGGLLAGIGGPVPKGVQALAQRMAAGYGWTGAQWNALRQLVQNESGWNPAAQNPTSTAYGLFQFLDSTWGSVGAVKTSSPVGQIAAGLRYIKQRYGSPIGARSFWMSHTPHWYGSGLDGIFRAPTLIGVGEAGPEHVSVTPLRKAGMGDDLGRLAKLLADELRANPPVVELDGQRVSPLIRKGLRSLGYRDGL